MQQVGGRSFAVDLLEKLAVNDFDVGQKARPSLKGQRISLVSRYCQDKDIHSVLLEAKGDLSPEAGQSASCIFSRLVRPR